MRDNISSPLRVLTCFAILVLTGCSPSDHAIVQQSTPKLDVVPADVRDQAVAASEELFKRLSGRLMQVLQEKGPAAAISICSQEAPKFAEAVGRERNLRIGRTSLKLRNPSNEPPLWAKALIESKPNEPQFFTLENNLVGALLPIHLKATCLLCHGPKDSILDDVKVELAKYYPHDQATGYQEGDVRGWFWMEIPESH